MTLYLRYVMVPSAFNEAIVNPLREIGVFVNDTRVNFITKILFGTYL
jgi:hypothetical protein